MLKYKEGVFGNPPVGPLAEALTIADKVYTWFGHDCTVTAIRNGDHKIASLHARGYAADIRTSDVNPQALTALHATLKAELGPAYDVVLETDSTPGASAGHIHIEFDPQHDGGKNIP